VNGVMQYACQIGIFGDLMLTIKLFLSIPETAE